MWPLSVLILIVIVEPYKSASKRPDERDPDSEVGSVCNCMSMGQRLNREQRQRGDQDQDQDQDATVPVHCDKHRQRQATECGYAAAALHGPLCLSNESLFGN